jgi:flagellar motor switch protein FliG
MNGIKKTAKFLSGLDWETVSQLFNRLDSETVNMLQREIRSVGNISLEESDQLANEFLKAAGRNPRQNRNRFVTETIEVSSGTYGAPSNSRRSSNFANLTDVEVGSSYDTSAVVNRNSRFALNQDIRQHQTTHLPEQSNNQYANQTNSQSFANRQNNNVDSRLFEFLFGASASDIAAIICDEHPQTVAVVLACLPDSLAGDVLAKFQSTLQQDVARRLAEIKLAEFDVSSNPVLFEIELELKQRFDKQRGSRFGDLDRLDDDALIGVFRSVDMKTAMCALVGAEPRFIERITGRFTPTEEFFMRKLLKQAGAINEDEIDNARAILVDRARTILSDKKVGDLSNMLKPF